MHIVKKEKIKLPIIYYKQSIFNNFAFVLDSYYLIPYRKSRFMQKQIHVLLMLKQFNDLKNFNLSEIFKYYQF